MALARREEELAACYRERMRHKHAQRLRGSMRREGFQHIAEEREKDRLARVAREREERRQARAAHPIPNWPGFLEAKAAAGDEAALAALRSRRRRAQQLGADVLTPRTPTRRATPCNGTCSRRSAGTAA